MGDGKYNFADRTLRASSAGYASKRVDDVFEQNKKRAIHETMNPKGIKFRESRDSISHPNSVPIIIGLDVTGSMGHIPHDLVKEGLPTMMSLLIGKGVEDAAVCFIAIGDHKNDSAPLQVGQFESGDSELDLHLTRTWLEGDGGGNGGESYPLAWYFAARKTKIDSFDLRGKKGYIVTIGNEPFHETLPKTSLKEIFGDDEVTEGTTAEAIYTEASKKWDIFHIAVDTDYGKSSWKKLLKENYIEVKNFKDIPKVIAKIVTDHEHISVGKKPLRESEAYESAKVDKETEEVL